MPSGESFGIQLSTWWWQIIFQVVCKNSNLKFVWNLFSVNSWIPASNLTQKAISYVSVQEPNIKSSKSSTKSRSQGWTCNVRIQVQALATKTLFFHPKRPQLLSDGCTPAFENWTNRLFASKFHLNVEVHFLKRHQKQNNKINLMSAPETWYEIIKFQSEEKTGSEGAPGMPSMLHTRVVWRRLQSEPDNDEKRAELLLTASAVNSFRRAVNWVSHSPHSRDYPALAVQIESKQQTGWKAIRAGRKAKTSPQIRQPRD